MKMEEIFKKIYQDLKEKIENKNNRTFVLEYTIPSINYSNIEDKKDLYFASGIEMEIERILEQLEHKFFYSSYKDKYFFSNEQSIVEQSVLYEINRENEIKLKQELVERLEQEYSNLVKELEQASPKQIIDSAYELVLKEQIKYELQDRKYTTKEIKALLKQENILSEFYYGWESADGKLGDILQQNMERTMSSIVDKYTRIQAMKKQESR